MQRRPELLSPAGNRLNLGYALAYGADAVYAGIPRYSLRVRNNDFHRMEHLAEGIAATHRQGRRFFLACNLMPHGAKVKSFLADIAPAVALGPDALIMADPGLILLVRENWPQMPIHLSVQANTVNAESVRFWQQFGISRVILSRELSLDEIAEIRDACPDVELEVFVHGALCMAYSGRCLLSGYFNHRDANQGSCTNTCRWDFKIAHAGQPDPAADAAKGSCCADTGARRHAEADEVYLLEEPQRPGEYAPIFEDEHGTYIMNSKDLRAVEHVHRLVAIGVDCVKIEGRTKSSYYTARTTQVYRAVIDDALAGRPFRPELIGELDKLANRGYTDAFYQRHESQELQNYRRSGSSTEKQQFVAAVAGADERPGWWRLEVKNRFAVGDRLELMTPGGNHQFLLEGMLGERGEPMEVAPGGGYRVSIPAPVGDARWGMLTRVWAD
jgi:putative protease